jgi:hypothetical protein
MKKNPGVPELHMMITYDPETKTYPACLLSGPFRSFLTGTWAKNTETMHWSGKDLDANKITGKHRHLQGSCRSIDRDEKRRWRTRGGIFLHADPARP